jgi:hypothetical protein
MSRTYRKAPKTGKRIRDGEDFRPSRACRHNGPCPYCANGRTHSNRRRIPAQEMYV